MQDGDIDMITTDHSPSTIDLKHLDDGDFLKAWGGITGIQVKSTRSSYVHRRFFTKDDVDLNWVHFGDKS